VILGASRGQDTIAGTSFFELRQLDLDSGRRRSIALGFFPHGIAFDPHQPNRAFLFEKKGPGACEVDLHEGRMVRPLTTAADRSFYGHGTFSADGTLLFSTETETSTHDGVLLMRDAQTLEVVEELPTFGKNPHDCCLIDGGRTLVVTNGGGAFPDGDAPSVTFIEVQSRKLLDRLIFSNPRINAGHVVVGRDRSVAVASAPRDGLSPSDHGGLSLRGPTGALETMTEPVEVAQGMLGETLSLSLHESSGHLAVTSPTGNQLSFWRMRDRKLAKALTVKAARGVTQTLDGALFVVSSGPTGSLGFYSPKTLRESAELRRPDVGMVGSHLYVWAGTVR
jgi:hypothetical protein